MLIWFTKKYFLSIIKIVVLLNTFGETEDFFFFFNVQNNTNY